MGFSHLILFTVGFSQRVEGCGIPRRLLDKRFEKRYRLCEVAGFNIGSSCIEHGFGVIRVNTEGAAKCFERILKPIGECFLMETLYGQSSGLWGEVRGKLEGKLEGKAWESINKQQNMLIFIEKALKLTKFH